MFVATSPLPVVTVNLTECVFCQEPFAIAAPTMTATTAMIVAAVVRACFEQASNHRATVRQFFVRLAAKLLAVSSNEAERFTIRKKVGADTWPGRTLSTALGLPVGHSGRCRLRLHVRSAGATASGT